MTLEKLCCRIAVIVCALAMALSLPRVHAQVIPNPPALDPHTTLTNSSPVTITGSSQGEFVEVSGPEGVFQVPVIAGSFSADVTLTADRVNSVFFTTISADDRSAPTPTFITFDTEPPSLFIDFPPDGAQVTNDMLDIAGRVSDMLSGFMGLTVLVNGTPAVVDVGIGTNGTFLLADVPLIMGPNTITAVAQDSLGNSIQKQVTVNRVDPTGVRMAVISGNGQVGTANSLLADKLEVKMTHDDLITPFVDKTVTFTVTRSDGLLSPVGGGPGSMVLQIPTDGMGIAEVSWTLGADAGSGNNRVEATSTSVSGTIFFCASATPGSATQINIGSGNNQVAEAGGPATLPLQVWVNDGCNGLDGVSVTFLVTDGNGTVNGQTTAPISTSSTGHAEVNFVLGPEAGQNAVAATFGGNPGQPAVFNITGVARDAQTPTSFVGTVLDNAERPIKNATCTLSVGGVPFGPSIMSDLEGQFRFDSITPAGPGHLFVDGFTATQVGGENGVIVPTGSFPSLGYNVVLTPNVENTLPTPVLLPTLNPINTQSFDNTADLTLAIDGIEGMEMLVRAGSMTRADNTVPTQLDPADISLNQVHFDEIPMPMPDGAAPPLAWTLQPAGAKFDPPIEITMPNMAGLPPGSAMFFLSFNHATEEFEIVATGHVTEDGDCMVTDPGSGISVAGWAGFCPPYPPSGTVQNMIDDTDEDLHADDPKPTMDPEPARPDPCPPSKDDNGTDPIYLFSGEFYEPVVDLQIKGRGLDFIWARKYRSKRGPNTVQGNGWDCSYNIFIQEQAPIPPDPDPEPNILLCNGNGRADLYHHKVDGTDETWSRKGFFRQLVKDLTFGTYTLRFANRGEWNFNAIDGSPAAGKIASIIDRNGNPISFAYDGSGRLQTITDTLARDITVAYNAEGFIESVTDFMLRSVTYEYYDGIEPGGNFGDLKSVTSPVVVGTLTGNDFPSGKTTVYTYSTGFADSRLNSNLLTITDPKGQTYLINTYATTQNPADPDFDRVVRQVWGGDTVDIVYVPQTPNPANRNAILQTIVNDRVGNVKEYFYDDKNRVVIQREYTGRWNPNQPTSDTDLVNPTVSKLRTTDPDFFETKYDWNRDWLQTQVIHPNGNITQTIYEGDLNAQADPRKRGNVRAIVRLPGTHLTPGDQANLVEVFEYDTDFAGACCGSNFVTRHIDRRGNLTEHQYDNQGNRLRTINRISLIVEDMEYNQFGQLTARTLPDNGSMHRRRDEYTYHAVGPQTGYLQQKIVDAAGFALATTYEYDLVGNVTRVTDPRLHDIQYIFNALDQVVRRISRKVADASSIRYERDTHYDANDNIVRIDIQNKDDAGVLQANTHFTTLFEYEILNFPTRMCAEVGNYIGAIPGTPNLPTCVGLPEIDFITTEYDYDGNRNQTLMRFGEATNGNQPANVVRTLFDERDLVFKTIRAEGDPDKSTTQFDYDRNRNLATVSEGLENQPRITNNTYDSYDRLVLTTDPMGNQRSFQYDPNSNVVLDRLEGESPDDVSGSSGNMRLSHTTSDYDDMDRLTTTEAEFFITDMPQPPILDGLATTTIQWSHNSQLLRFADDNDHQTLTTYDTANRRSTTTDHEGNIIALTYDNNSNVVAVLATEKSDLGNPDQSFTTDYEYDNLDRLSKVTNNVDNVWRRAYDSRNNQTLRVDSKGNVILCAYDGINRLTQKTRNMTDTGNGAGSLIGAITTLQTWDDTSRLKTQTDDNGNTTSYTYDPLNRQTTMQYEDQTVHTYDYDVHDNAITMLDANGSMVTCVYDLLNRLTDKTIVVGLGVSNDTTAENYKYDGLSRVVHAQDDDSLVTRSYDSLSSIVKETLNGQMTVTAYDGVGNALTCTYPGGRIITCTYDGLDRKKLISDSVGTIASYDYVGPGRVERREFGNGTRTDYSYDGILPNPPGDFGVKKIIGTTHSVIAGGAILDARTYTWDKMYNKTQRKDVRAASTGERLTHDYGYDSIYRIVNTAVTDAAALPVRDTGYVLDDVGNRTTVTGTPNPGNYLLSSNQPEPADAQTNQYTTTPFDARAYDRNGNLTATSFAPTALADVNHDLTVDLDDMDAMRAALLLGDPSNTFADINGDTEVDGGDMAPFCEAFFAEFGSTATVDLTYDYRNQMVEYHDLDSGRRDTYAYDAIGRRIAQTLDADGPANTTRYFYSGESQWQVCEEQDGAGNTSATYVYGGYIDEVLQMQRCEDIPPCAAAPPVDYYYHSDDMYNIVAVTDATGSVVERYEYDDYGTPTFMDAGGNVLAQPPGLRNPSWIANPYLFGGRRLDFTTGFYHYRTRYLEPSVGRFTTRDTIGIWGAAGNHGNGYTHVGNSPWTMLDPFGLDGLPWYSQAWNFGHDMGSVFLGMGRVPPALALSAAEGIGNYGQTLLDTAAHLAQGGSYSFDNAPARLEAYGRSIAAGVDAILDGNTDAMLSTWAPDLHSLINCWDQMSPEQRGESIGRLGTELAAMIAGLRAGVNFLGKKPPLPEGIIYRRTNPRTGRQYVGRANNAQNYSTRQLTHDRNLGVRHDYEVIGRAEPGTSLRVAEESGIRSNGGPRRYGGTLENRRWEMNPRDYNAAGGNVPKPID